jgi:hypothetical protein
MIAYWEVEVKLYAFFTSALDGGEWSAACPGCFTPQGKNSFYLLDRRLGGSQSRSGSSGKERNFQPLPGLEPAIVQPVVQQCKIKLTVLSKYNLSST